MINKKIARRYTLALYYTAEELNKVDKIMNDFNDIRNTIENSKDLEMFLKSPIIKTNKKLNVINDLFKGKVDELSLKFLLLLCEKNREIFIYDISIDLQNLIDEKRGIIKATVTTAIPLNEQERKSISEKLKEYTGKQIEPTFGIDKTIKGGFIAKIQDTIIDASIKRQLELLKQQFQKGTFINN